MKFGKVYPGLAHESVKLNFVRGAKKGETILMIPTTDVRPAGRVFASLTDLGVWAKHVGRLNDQIAMARLWYGMVVNQSWVLWGRARSC